MGRWHERHGHHRSKGGCIVDSTVAVARFDLIDHGVSDRRRMERRDGGIPRNLRAIMPIATPAGPAWCASPFSVPPVSARRRPGLNSADRTSRPVGARQLSIFAFPLAPPHPLWLRPVTTRCVPVPDPRPGNRPIPRPGLSALRSRPAARDCAPAMPSGRTAGRSARRNCRRATAPCAASATAGSAGRGRR